MGLKRPEIEIDAKECVSRLQCTVTIKGWKRFFWRVRIAFWLIKLAAFLFPGNMDIEKSEDSEDGGTDRAQS